MTVIYVTCATRKAAEELGRALIQERLIACANFWPVRSSYRFKGKVRRTSEWALFCKTRDQRAPAAVARIRARHGYALPVIEQWPVATSKAVEQWLQEATTKIA